MLYGVERQTKSDRPLKCDCASHSASSYLENRLTLENQTWYAIKRVILEYIIDTIFKIIFSPIGLQQRNYDSYNSIFLTFLINFFLSIIFV